MKGYLHNKMNPKFPYFQNLGMNYFAQIMNSKKIKSNSNQNIL